MPGKGNPVIPEMVNQVAFTVVGNDVTVTMAAEAGQLQLNAFEPVIDLIRKSVPVLVLDVPHLWTNWAKSTLMAADDVVITATPDLANLRNTKNLVDLLKDLRPHDRPPILVLNQVGVPKRPEIAPKDFASALELEVTAVIGFEPQLFATAANNGQMIAEMQAAANFAQAIKKMPVRCHECPGFVVNRILVSTASEIWRYQDESGIDVEQLDEFIRERAQMPMGPFRVADMSGLDTVVKVARDMQEAYGDRFYVHKGMEEMLERGELGAKTGKGFYEHR
jgi:hypothetical protein